MTCTQKHGISIAMAHCLREMDAPWRPRRHKYAPRKVVYVGQSGRRLGMPSYAPSGVIYAPVALAFLTTLLYSPESMWPDPDVQSLVTSTLRATTAGDDVGSAYAPIIPRPQSDADPFERSLRAARLALDGDWVVGNARFVKSSPPDMNVITVDRESCYTVAFYASHVDANPSLNVMAALPETLALLGLLRSGAGRTWLRSATGHETIVKTLAKAKTPQ